MEILGIDAEWLALGAAALVFALLALAEVLAPHRASGLPRMQRWPTNLALFVLDTALVRLAIPLLMVGAAALASAQGWGLFNRTDWPLWLEFALTLLALDLALYFQHWATHRVPLLWRMHKVHHSDPDFDVTTAARFHPVEIMLSMLYKMAVVVALGPMVLAVFVFELVFTLATLFTHANIGLPARADQAVRTLIVTPDMHRIHHSSREAETNSNYGTMLSAWDRLFGTYVRESERGREGITIGLDAYQDGRPARLGWSLLLPLRK